MAQHEEIQKNSKEGTGSVVFLFIIAIMLCLVYCGGAWKNNCHVNQWINERPDEVKAKVKSIGTLIPPLDQQAGSCTLSLRAGP